MGSNEFAYEAMQKAAVHGLPWAIAMFSVTFLPWLKANETELTQRLLMQIGVPLAVFDNVEREMVQFPAFDEGAFYKGIRIGNFERRIFYNLAP